MAFPSYQNIFNGNPVYPSTVSYEALVLTTAVTTLGWPITTMVSDNVVSSVIEVYSTYSGTNEQLVFTGFSTNPNNLSAASNPSVINASIFDYNLTYEFTVTSQGTPNVTLSSGSLTQTIDTDITQVTSLNFTNIGLTLNWALSTDLTPMVGNPGNISAINLISIAQLQLPPADQVSVGQQTLIRNTGDSSISLTDNDGNNLLTIEANQAFYVYLTDNTSEAGVWSSIQFGTGTSKADADALDGYGLTVLTNGTTSTLNSQIKVNPSITSDYTIQATDRASLIVIAGGNVNITLPKGLPTGFIVYLGAVNQAAVSAVAAGGGYINYATLTTIGIPDGFSGGFITDGTNWYTLGSFLQTSTTQVVFEPGTLASPGIQFNTSAVPGFYLDTTNNFIGVSYNQNLVSNFNGNGLTIPCGTSGEYSLTCYNPSAQNTPYNIMYYSPDLSEVTNGIVTFNPSIISNGTYYRNTMNIFSLMRAYN